MTKWDLFQVLKVDSTLQKSFNVSHHVNGLKKKGLINGRRKAFDKTQHPFMIKLLCKLGIEGASLTW